MFRKLGRGLVVLLLAGMSSWAFAGHEWSGRNLEQGRVLYEDTCASCHGAKLEGQENWRSPFPDGTMRAPPHDDSGHTWHHPTGFLFFYTKLGGAEALRQMGVTGVTSGMPAFADSLSDDDIMNILAYIRSHWSARAKAHQEQVSHQN